MAKFAHSDRAPVDAVAERWRDDCLLGDGSLFFEGEQVWTADNAQELVEHFTENQLEDERSFEDKLSVQLAPVSPGAKRLMAEVIAAYFFFATNVHGPRKRELVSFVLEMAGDTLPDNDVTRAFDTGIGSAGQAFNSYRPDLLQYLIGFTRRFKGLDDDKRLQVLSDAWGFRRWLVGDDGEADGGEQMMRHILLHLLFPVEFERIASADHKYRIADTFEGLLDGQPVEDDIDHRLWAIRQRIEELMPEGQPTIGGAVDFYETPLLEAWDPTEEDRSEGAGGISNLGALEAKRAVVLYGPPGTGKTYEAKDLARRLIRHQALVRWKAVGFLQYRDLMEELADRQIRRLQLHQNYSYEDFIWGMRVGPGGATVPQEGYLLQLVDEIEGSRQEPAPGLEPLPWVLILDEVNRVDLSRLLGEAFSTLEDRDAEVDLPMLDEDGNRRTLRLPDDLYLVATMNLIDQSVEQLDFALRRRFLWLKSGFDGEAIPEVVRHRWEQLDASRHHPWERLGREIEQLAERAALLNEHIHNSPLLGEQYELGHTYYFDVTSFIRAWPRVRLKGQRPRGYLWHPSGRPEPPLLDLWRHSLCPLVEEYLAGIEPQAARAERDRLRDVFLRGVEA